MNNSHRVAAGAAALIAAGIVGVGSAESASAAQPHEKVLRITSAQQLKDSIARAVAIEQQSGPASLGTQPQGRAAQTTFGPACSA